MEKKVPSKTLIKLSTWLLIIAMAGITTTGCSMSSKQTNAKQTSSKAETVSSEQAKEQSGEQGQLAKESTKGATTKDNQVSDKTLNNLIQQYVNLLNKRDDKLIEKIIVAKSPAEVYTKNILQELRYVKPKYTYKNLKVTHKEDIRATVSFSLNVHKQTLNVIAIIQKQGQNWKIYELLFPSSKIDS